MGWKLLFAIAQYSPALSNGRLASVISCRYEMSASLDAIELWRCFVLLSPFGMSSHGLGDICIGCIQYRIDSFAASSSREHAEDKSLLKICFPRIVWHEMKCDVRFLPLFNISGH